MPEPNPKEKEKKVLVEYLPQPSTEEKNDEVLEVHLGAPEPYWMDPILAYLRDGVLPVDKKEARRILYQAANYTMVNGTLYTRGLSLPLLRYLRLEEGKKVLEELYAGVCSNHIKSYALHIHALRLSYYCPTLKGDAKELVQRCYKC